MIKSVIFILMKKKTWLIMRNGFTLLEMSVIIVVIALILGAAMRGADLMRLATGQNIAVNFVTGWSSAFQTFLKNQSNIPPGGNATARFVNGAIDTPLGGVNLANAMLSGGATIPDGDTPARPDLYTYLDQNGNPQVLTVLIRTTNWAVLSSALGSYATVPAQVLEIQGLTAELAMQLDHYLDGNVDARFGSFRIDNRANDTGVGVNGVSWPNAVIPLNAAAPVLTAYYRVDN